MQSTAVTVKDEASPAQPRRYINVAAVHLPSFESPPSPVPWL